MKEESQNEVSLTETEVFDIIKFALQLETGLLDSGGALSPLLLNQRMKDITLNPMQATEQVVSAALNNPKDSEEILQQFSQDYEIQSQAYKALLAYLGNMLSFDLSYYVSPIKKDGTLIRNFDYSGAKYRKDLTIVKEFLTKFDYKEEFSKVVKGLLRNETFFGLPRFGGNSRIVIQEFPPSPKYSMITGRWEYGLLFSVNMFWFQLQGVDINMYPRFFKQKLSELFDGSTPKYNPALSPIMRGSNSWVYWQDVPADIGFCWKMTPEIVTRIPYFSGLFPDLLQQPVIRSLQKNINMSVAARLLFGEIATLKDATAKKPNNFVIDHELLGKFLAVVKSAVGESIKVAGFPLQNVQGMSFPAENEVYSSYWKTALATSGVNTNLIFTSDVRPNSLESQLSLNVDEQLMYSLYPQFSNFLEYYVNQRTHDFNFKFDFEGTQFYNNRKERLEKQIQLVDKGIVMPQKIAAAIGMTYESFSQQMAEAKSMGWIDELTPIVSAYQMSGTNNAGRPQKDDNDLSDSGEETRSAGSNLEKDGNI